MVELPQIIEGIKILPIHLSIGNISFDVTLLTYNVYCCIVLLVCSVTYNRVTTKNVARILHGGEVGSIQSNFLLMSLHRTAAPVDLCAGDCTYTFWQRYSSALVNFSILS